MLNKLTKTIAGLAVAGVAVAGLAACSSPAPAPTPAPTVEPAPTEAPIGGDIVAPVSVNLLELNGTVQTVVVGQAINLLVTDEDPAVWSGVSSDTAVATVSEGVKQDDANGVAGMNPGVQAVKTGKATITFTNSFTGEEVKFDVLVLEKSATGGAVEEDVDVAVESTIETPDATVAP